MNFIRNKFLIVITLTISASTIFFACNKNDDDIITEPIAIVKPDIVFYGLNDANQIIKYNAKATESPETGLAVTGLQPSEKLMSIDFRPATGQLYALGNSSRLYAINLSTGSATALGVASFTPAISGTIANIDFNPTVDRVRLVTNTGQNLRLHPETGAVAAVDLAINGNASPAITSIAYSNSISGASATDLFDIDISTKKLFKQSPPNDGTLVEVGNLNVNFTGKAGFDINADNSAILATLVVDNVVKLYTVNTTTAATTFISNIAANIIDIAIPTNAVAYAISDAGMFQTFDPTKANSVVSKAITGLNVGESIVGIDFRPATGQLYGLATTVIGNARLITFNLSTGATAGVGTGFSITLGTTAAGFDFNPTVDRIRVVTNVGQNLRLNPIDGTIAAIDVNLNPGTPTATSAAYTNNFAGATTTSLFVMDATKLYIQNPPNAGTLIEVGTLGVTVDAQSGFDIGGKSNNAFSLLTVGNSTKVYSVNITSGAVTAGVDYPNKVSAMAIGLGF
jgi:Domain of unknown function (DUF4394)